MKTTKIVSAISLLVSLLKPRVIDEKEAPQHEQKAEMRHQNSVEHALIMCRLQINASC